MGTTKKSLKFKDKAVDLGLRPVVIVGERPGKQHKGRETGVVWEGNRSGDFIDSVVKDYQLTNVFLTNIFSRQNSTELQKLNDVSEFLAKMVVLLPRKVICLGDTAYDVLKNKAPVPIVRLQHPSFILRFNMDREAYIDKLVKEART